MVGGLALGAEQVPIETDLGRLDIVQGLDGVPNFDDLNDRSVEAEILGVKVAVCALDDLRKMKQAAGRTRDLAASRISMPPAISSRISTPAPTAQLDRATPS